MTISITEAKTKTFHELCTSGRFNLRMLALELGMLASEEDKRDFTARSSAGQTSLIYNRLHRPNTRPWMQEPWVKELFEEQPSVMSLSELRVPGPHTYVVVVKTGDDGLVYGTLHKAEFTLNTISDLVQDLQDKGWEDSNGNWMQGTPHESTVHYVLGRAAFFGNAADEEVPATEETQGTTTYAEYDVKADCAEYDRVVQGHGMWMWTAMRRWQQITSIEKAFNTQRSPTTFALILSGGHRHTWMKAPDIDKVRDRLMRPRDSMRSGSMQHLPLFPEGPPTGSRGMIFTKLGLEVALVRLGILTAENVDAANAQAKKEKPTAAQVDADTEDRIDRGHERRQPKKVDACAECGASFATNLQFGRGADNLCGECQIKKAGDHAWDDHELGPKAFPARGPQKKFNPKFDPRPGIDDVGLGFSSSTWED